jgi:predicted Rossmann fold flavoprotein
MKQETYDIIVIGGGPSGMMAAGRAGELGARVLLIEKNDRLGKKLSITGGRRCNITNAEFDNHLFLNNFPEAKRFLLSPFSQFNVESTFEFFEGKGLPLVVEDRKRAFPESQKAEDVCSVLGAYVMNNNVTVKLETSVRSFIVVKKKLKGVRTSEGDFMASKIILATGGLAAPETGSTGDGLSMLEDVGHTVKESDSDLAPLRVKDAWIHNLSGVTVDDVVLKFNQKEKTKFKTRGRILFTHFGISGPMVINSAHKVKELLKKGKVTAAIDLFPDENLGELDSRLVELFDQNKNKKFRTVFKNVLERKMSEVFVEEFCGDIADRSVHSVSKEERKLIVRKLKGLSFRVAGLMGLDWSIVADGGVVPEEIDFKNMSSRLYPNLYLIGDAININRPSGGFSLQLCWTTGFVSGSDAAILG